ncbi:hypothetical protein B0H14DRAFT_2615595 [Mycena olivaceomarginata]|nr:hypothetical protein B0H14DRAFT_2615595 [Mycena olivaceomarginata]
MSLLHEAPPPSYDPSEGLAAAADYELPTYPGRILPSRCTMSTGQPATPKEFSYEMKWATLILLGHPILSRTTPTFIDRSDITGSLKLNLRSPDPIKSVTVFTLQRAQTEKNDSASLTHSPIALRGGSIQYYLELRISRGIPDSVYFCTELRSLNCRINTPFELFTLHFLSPPSQLRQHAYCTNIPIHGPHSDPDGWQAVEPVQVKGKLSGDRAVNAKCTVFLAKPLCYTWNTSIPCAMTIETDDLQVADVLASIKSLAFPRGQAVWWPAPDTDMAHLGNAAQQHIMGEIHLRRDLHLSTAINKFQVEASTVILDAVERQLVDNSYAVAVFPPAAVAFGPHSTGPLITQTMEIVTGHAEGVQARTATIPPANELSDPFVERYYKSVAGPKPMPPSGG